METTLGTTYLPAWSIHRLLICIQKTKSSRVRPTELMQKISSIRTLSSGVDSFLLPFFLFFLLTIELAEHLRKTSHDV